jgi:hypothetical protein
MVQAKLRKRANPQQPFDLDMKLARIAPVFRINGRFAKQQAGRA